MLVSRNLAKTISNSKNAKNIHTSCRKFAPVPMTYASYSSPELDRNSPLVIVHGLFGQKQNWNSVGKALHKKLEAPVYAVDVRNHGSSPHTETMSYTEMAEDLVLFIDKVKEETKKTRVNLLGHSMGGKIVMRLAIDSKWSDRIEKLIVEDVSPKGYSRRHLEFRELIKTMRNVDLCRTRKEILKDLESAIPDLAMRQFILTNLQPSSENEGQMEWKININTIDSHVDEILGYTLPVGSFRGPTLFLHGANSGYVPDDHKPDIKCLFPQVQFDAIPDSGHWVHAEKPQLFINSVYKFLKP
ncbi:sn-1-specific diacylglycerol lipase ABHD11 [Caenorhabditis elegans]|uniref:sn-1-specific diacylglycerol lipase ABHD11 n=1 Tax=Caenorhabditis elegans TaxID=6239 RepID=O45707_CAEEL|nr:AB hydrolase-1 domain-containing protein [Caenorhabditis elegans]CAB03219.1 AB hydrolase-1 domain-containing protein [Caenorhabditis elegans]|eukprot:NP_493077.1 ABHydrolase Domain containing homolog [Caenorhabditis elegans]